MPLQVTAVACAARHWGRAAAEEEKQEEQEETGQ